jgi:predicted DCC family thiol-disulfide oxidoreductase YuxK
MNATDSGYLETQTMGIIPGMTTEYKSIILFDGVCNLCNGFVKFVIPRDRNNRFPVRCIAG